MVRGDGQQSANSFDRGSKFSNFSDRDQSLIFKDIKGNETNRISTTVIMDEEESDAPDN